MTLPFTLAPPTGPNLGLIVLQADETIELEMRQLLPDVPYYVSRVPSGTNVTPDTLTQMANHLTTAADLLPRGMTFDTVAYACTSAASFIGSDRINSLITRSTPTAHTTDPVRALIAACKHMRLQRLGLITPYIASVSDRLRSTLQTAGITTPAFGSFNQSQESKVVRIDTASLVAAGRQIAAQAPIDGLFLSCTNLRTLAAIPQLEASLNLPVISSNSALAWHMTQLAKTTNSPFGCKLNSQS